MCDTVGQEKSAVDDSKIEVLELARQFHEAYERLAPRFGFVTRPETRAFDLTTPNGRLMLAVCKELVGGPLQDLAAFKRIGNLIRQNGGCTVLLGLHEIFIPSTIPQVDPRIVEAALNAGKPAVIATPGATCDGQPLDKVTLSL